MAWRRSKDTDFLEQVRLVRRLHNQMAQQETPEKRQLFRASRDDEIVIALEMLCQAPGIWRNGEENDHPSWLALLKMPGSAPLLWLLAGMIFAAIITGQLRLVDFLKFIVGAS